jgi:flavodoxin
MRALVVYESIYGNTRQVAEAIAEGLEGSAEVQVVPVAQAAGTAGLDLVVAGGPTHMHGLSSSLSRKMAVKAAEDEDLEVEPGAAEGPGLRSWLSDLHSNGTLVAAFDTRADASPTLTGMAARGIAKRFRNRGFDLIDEPQSYLVADSEGPLADGELERARAWGETLAAQLAERAATVGS